MNNKMTSVLKHGLLILIIGLLGACDKTTQIQEAEITNDRDIYVPLTVSSSGQQILRALGKSKRYTRIVPAATDLEGWRKTHANFETASVETNRKAVERTGVKVTETKMGGTPVLDVRPKGWNKSQKKVIVYTHGGAYTLFSARSSLFSSAPMSEATGLRVISVDYTTAPAANWKKIQDQVLAVFKALLADGYKMSDIAMYGDSAGGGLVTSTVLNLRNNGLGMPAVVVLWAPWVDLKNVGDTAHTLAKDDPLLDYDNLLGPSAQAYADGLALSDVRISPIHADFSKGFPPTLIQAGTKEIFLSTSVRLYQKLEAAAQHVKLDVYEGMPHVFQQFPIDETKVAIGKSASFINKYLLIKR